MGMDMYVSNRNNRHVCLLCKVYFKEGEALLFWGGAYAYACVCLCACVCACVCLCVHAYLHVCALNFFKSTYFV